MAVSVQQELSISSMDPVSSFNSPPNQKRARPQLKLETNQDKPEEKKILIRQNSINSYVVENHPIATDISKSASPSKTSSKNFFNIFLGQENNDEHSFVGPYYYVLQRSNGKEMQDRYKASVFSKDKAYFGVFDGHSSQIIPELAAQKLDQYFLEYMKTQNDISSALRSAFCQIEEEAIRYLKEKNTRGGTTAISVVFHKDYLCVCNLGDCQAVLFQKDSYKCLSNIHDYHNEHERHAVEQRGGIILKNRLEGEMALTRSIGDFKYKKFMSSEPEIVEHQITEQDKYLIIASDGVWNGISPQAVLTRLKEFETKNMFKGVSLKFIGDCLLHEASNNIKTKKDNMSLIVISIKEYMSGL